MCSWGLSADHSSARFSLRGFAGFASDPFIPEQMLYAMPAGWQGQTQRRGSLSPQALESFEAKQC